MTISSRKQHTYITIDLTVVALFNTLVNRQHMTEVGYCGRACHLAFVRCLRNVGQDRGMWSLHAALQGAASFRITPCILADIHRHPQNTYHVSACL